MEVSTLMSEKQFDKKLTELLKTNSDFVGDTGELRRENIKNRAWDFDRELVSLLLSDETIASHFFDEVSEGRFIFNNKEFIKYLNQMHFYAKSHTQFKNKIGLMIDDKYLRERGEVALAFPYKDCVLEGGQTKEDDKRNEVFFNELLAKDEINRMLDPKVLTNWKRHTTTGEEDVTEITRDDKGIIRENLIIKGNNLIALHTLKQQFRGQVNMIYADPPYNTGGGNIFSYNNSFNHSAWLTFMKNRLEVARDLLMKDGILVIAIDDAEMYYLGVILDEVFGRNNKIGVVSIRHHPRGRTQSSFLSAVHEYALFYAKDITKITKDFRFDTDEVEEEESFIRGREDAIPEKKPDYYYPIFYNPTTQEITLDEKGKGFVKILPENRNGMRTWQRKPEAFLQKLKEKKIVVKGDNGIYNIYWQIARKKNKAQTMWTKSRYDANHHGTILLKNLFGGQNPFSFPKSLYTLLDIVKLTTDKNDIVLDFFAGSGTTGHAVSELNKQDNGNRQFILVEQLEEHIAVCKERLEKVMTKGNFISCELMPYNQNILDRIQSATERETLLDIWREMCTGVSVLKWYLDTDNIEEAEKAFIAIDDVEQQQIALIELLNKTHLYVHFSEMDDENAKVNDTDKRLTRLFYEGDADAKS